MLGAREQRSGQLGGRPQLIEMGLDKAERPQTCYFSWFVELKWVKHQQITSKLPVV